MIVDTKIRLSSRIIIYFHCRLSELQYKMNIKEGNSKNDFHLFQLRPVRDNIFTR